MSQRQPGDSTPGRELRGELSTIQLRLARQKWHIVHSIHQAPHYAQSRVAQCYNRVGCCTLKLVKQSLAVRLGGLPDDGVLGGMQQQVRNRQPESLGERLVGVLDALLAAMAHGASP